MSIAVRSDDRSALSMRTDIYEDEMNIPAQIKQPLPRQDIQMDGKRHEYQRHPLWR